MAGLDPLSAFQMMCLSIASGYYTAGDMPSQVLDMALLVTTDELKAGFEQIGAPELSSLARHFTDWACNQGYDGKKEPKPEWLGLDFDDRKLVL